MPNIFDQYDEAPAAASAPTRNPFDEYDQPDTPKTVSAGEGLGYAAERGLLALRNIPNVIALSAQGDLQRNPIVRYTAEQQTREPMFNALLEAGQEPGAQAEAYFRTGPEAVLRAKQLALAKPVVENIKASAALPLSEAQARLATAKGAKEQFIAWARDPAELTASIILESLPPSLAGVIIGSLGGPVGTATGVGLSSGVSTFASELLGNAANRGINIQDANAVTDWLGSKEFTEDFDAAAKKSTVIGAIDAATAGHAGHFIEGALKQGVRKAAIATAKEVGVQAAGGAGGEALGSIVAGQPVDPFNVFAEAIAEVGSAPGEVVSNLRNSRIRAAPVPERSRLRPPLIERPPVTADTGQQLPAPIAPPPIPEVVGQVEYTGYKYEKRADGNWYQVGSTDPLPQGKSKASASKTDREAARFISELERRLPVPTVVAPPVAPAAPVTPVVPTPTTPATPTPVSVPVMITKAMEAQLAGLGYAPEDINAMKPEDANTILAGKVRKPVTVTPPVVPVVTPTALTPEETVEMAELQAIDDKGQLGASKLTRLVELQRKSAGTPAPVVAAPVVAPAAPAKKVKPAKAAKAKPPIIDAPVIAPDTFIADVELAPPTKTEGKAGQGRRVAGFTDLTQYTEPGEAAVRIKNDPPYSGAVGEAGGLQGEGTIVVTAYSVKGSDQVLLLGTHKRRGKSGGVMLDIGKAKNEYSGAVKDKKLTPIGMFILKAPVNSFRGVMSRTEYNAMAAQAGTQIAETEKAIGTAPAKRAVSQGKQGELTVVSEEGAPEFATVAEFLAARVGLLTGLTREQAKSQALQLLADRETRAEAIASFNAQFPNLAASPEFAGLSDKAKSKKLATMFADIVYEESNKGNVRAGVQGTGSEAGAAGVPAAVATPAAAPGAAVTAAAPAQPAVAAEAAGAQPAEVVRESKPATTTSTGIAPAEVEQALTALGIQPGSIITVINDPNVGVDGRAVFDTRTGQLKRIELNAAKILNTARAIEILTHELSHVASEDGSLASAIAELTEQERIGIVEDMRRLGYGDNAKELDARATQALVNAWNNRSWFAKLTGSILDIARRIGIPMTRLAAEHAAARAVAQAFENAKAEAGGTGVGTFTTSNARVVAPWFREALSLVAHHGTPHKVDRFTTAKIGTGEGAGAYGWGLYFAENQAVSRQYAESLGGGKDVFVDGVLQKEPKTMTPLKWAINFVRDTGSVEKAIESMRRIIFEHNNVGVESDRKALAYLESWVGRDVSVRPRGREYTVTLNTTPDELLDWDKPLSQQVQQAMIASGVTISPMGERGGAPVMIVEGGPFKVRTVISPATGGGLYTQLENALASQRTFGSGATQWSGNAPNAQAASEYLASLGIKGIRYLDQGSRTVPDFVDRIEHLLNQARQKLAELDLYDPPATPSDFAEQRQKIAGLEKELSNAEALSQTSNYVIFNEDDIAITHENGQRVTPTGLAEQKEAVRESRVEPGLQVDEGGIVDDPNEPAPLPDEKWVPIQVQGQQSFVRGRDRLTPETFQASTAAAQEALTASGFAPVLQTFIDPADGQTKTILSVPRTDNADAKGRALGERLEEAIRNKNVQGRADPAMLINTIREGYSRPDSAFADMTSSTRNWLFGIAHEDASVRGRALRALRNFRGDVLNVARNVDVFLTRIYSIAYGGESVASVINTARDTVRAGVTPAVVIEVAANAGPASPAVATAVTEAVQGRFTGIDDVIARVRAGLIRSGMTEQQADSIMASGVASTLRKRLKELATKAAKAVKTPSQKYEEGILAPARGGKRTPKRWKTVSDLIASGVLDDAEALAKIAKSEGWRVPTDAEKAEMRKLADREQQLMALTDKQLADTVGNPKKRAELQAATEASTDERRKKIRKQLAVKWSQFSTPTTISLTNPVSYGQQPRNNAKFLNELVAANLLFKASFGTKQLVDVLTQWFGRMPGRALSEALDLRQDDIRSGRKTEFFKDAEYALRKTYRDTITALKPAIARARAAWAGRIESRNVDRMMSGINAFERIALQADEAAANKEPIKAFLLRAVGIIQFGYRYAGSIDFIHGTPAEWHERRFRTLQELRKAGYDRAAAEANADFVMGDVNTEIVEAIALAKSLREAQGDTAATTEQIREEAWDIVERRQYERGNTLGLPVDAIWQEASLRRNTLGWNLPERRGLGGLVGATVTGVGQLFENVGIPTALSRFGNAIAIGINNNLRRTFLYQMANMPLPFIQGGREPSFWHRTATDMYERRIQAAMGTGIGGILLGLAWAGIVKVWLRPPRDKEDRELWEREGHKSGTVEIPLDDGKVSVWSLSTGPFAMFAPYFAAGGALNDLSVARQKAQDKLNADAEKLGLPPGQLPPLGLADYFNVGAQAAEGAILGNRTASGLFQSLTDYGKWNVKKFVASQLSPLVPGLPAMQEVARMSNVVLDPDKAGVLDFMFPLPSSGARKVNMLGDPVGTEDALQRVTQILTAGSYPVVNIEDAKANAAYAAMYTSGFKPPSIDPLKGYAIGGEFRPLTNSELAQYTEARGHNLKAALSDLPPDSDAKTVRAAYQQANAAALQEIGVETQQSTGTRTGGTRTAAGTGASRSGTGGGSSSYRGYAGSRIAGRRVGLSRLRGAKRLGGSRIRTRGFRRFGGRRQGNRLRRI